MKNDIKVYNKILYNIDMVNGFVKEGVLHDKKIADTIPEQIRLIEKFKQEKQGLGFIKDSHKEGCMEFNTFPKHCVIGTSEAELVDELKYYEKDAMIYLKNSTSALFAPNMIKDLEEMENLEEVVATGCCTDICIPNFLIPLKNYFNQNNRNISIFAVKKAIETYDIPGIHDRDYYTLIAYELMAQAGIIIVEDIEELEQKEKQLMKGRR